MREQLQRIADELERLNATMTRFGFLSNYLSETLNLNSSLKIQDSDSEIKILRLVSSLGKSENPFFSRLIVDIEAILAMLGRHALDAKAFHDFMQAELQRLGYDVGREYPVPLDNGHRGFIDLVVYNHHAPSVAIELDRCSPRTGSIEKLLKSGWANMIILRDVAPGQTLPDGIDVLLGVPMKRERPHRERRKPRTALPEDFQPNERAMELAKGYGLNIHKEMAAFRDFHTANGSVFRDWQAAFRTWLRKALYFAKRGA
jgi:hypothetical protein